MPSNSTTPLRMWLVVIAICSVVMGPARGQETGPPSHVTEFMGRLQRTANAAGRDVNTEAFHFVLLLNTVRTAGAGSHWARDAASHMLHNYLTVGDRVSILPYQLGVRPEAVWDQAFDRAQAEQLYKTIPLEPMQPVLGHDTERAVLEAAQRLGAPPSAIYITLSDSEASQRPLDHRWNQTMQRAWRGLFESGALREAEKGRITGIALDAQRRPHPATLYYRFYLPGELSPMAGDIERPPVQGPLLSIRVADGHTPLAGASVTLVQGELQLEGRTDADGVATFRLAKGIWDLVVAHAGFAQYRERCHVEADDSISVQLTSRPPVWPGLLAAAAALGAVAYAAYWLLQPRQVTVRYGDDEYHGSVTMGSQTRIGGKDCKGIELPGLDEGTKLLVLSTDALGRVVARGHAPYTIISPKEPVMLDRAHRRLTIKRMDDTLDLEIWRS